MRRAVIVLATSVAVVAWLPPVQAATASIPSPSQSMSADVSREGVAQPRVSQERAAHPRDARGSAKGRQGQTLTVSPARGLAVSGQTVRVSGRGFSERVGIYVGLCVLPRPGAKPTPCGGGVDQDGSTQASAWISSNPPPYGSRLAIPYKPGGNFNVRIKVSPRIGSFDCRLVRCAVVARADHLRANDRTWDVAVPVTFR